MNLLQLTVFREVMLAGSVSQAARNLHRTQPAISSTIAQLESELGFCLFERKGKRLSPVPEAHYLLAEATEILDRMTSAQRNMQNLRNLESGSLRIVAMPGPSVFLLPRMISRITRAHDGIKVTVLTRSSPQVHQLMSTQSYDLGIADLGVEFGMNTQLVRSEPFASDCICAVPAGDPLAQQPVLTPADLDARPLAALHADHHSHKELHKAFSLAGRHLDVRFETQYYLPLLTFVEDGLACAIIDTLSAESYLHYRGTDQDSVVFRPFRPGISLAFATLTPAHRPPSKLAESFIALWHDEVRRINQYWGAI
ncbi:MAG: LysR family transcriptional regulator [Roseovarius sp.]|jgi:DNA-binding transcriptional LysR family regulator|nr:LysR family transcriptional regulator [Roseovarius sp.]